MIKSMPGFQSVNTVQMLGNGAYEISEIEFVSPASDSRATMVEICDVAQAELRGCDLIIVLKNSSVLFRDFGKMENGTWRDSNGLVGDSLAALLPAELADFQQEGDETKSRFTLTDGTIAWM